jgi:opacity protein-like surface antigen
VRGGVPLNDFFNAASNPSATFQSSSGRFILGPSIEVHFPAGFGIEADALYKHFNYNAFTNPVPALTSINSKASNSWEFPLLVKYKVKGSVIRPFLDAGVAFDHWSGFREITNAVGLTKTNVSGTNTGVVLGGGLEFHVPFVRISPEIRYTRWSANNLSDFGGILQSNHNQAEFLIGLTF